MGNGSCSISTSLLNGAIDDIADDACEATSYQKLCIYITLKYNSEATITSAKVDEIVALLGDNLNEVTAEQINQTRTSLAEVFGITNATDF